MHYACINGEFLPADTFHISPEDRSFRFGDGCFETILVRQHTPYQLDLHLDRLVDGTDALDIQIDRSQVTHNITALIAKNALTDGTVRITLSRGSGSRGYLPTGSEPLTLITTSPLQAPPSTPLRLSVSAWRMIPPACLPTQAKLNQAVNRVLTRKAAHDAGYNDALMLSVDGYIGETSSANLFWLEGDRLYTSPASTGLLPGTTRAALMRLHPVDDILAPLERLEQAEAVWVTNVVLGIHPVASIDGIATQWHEHPKTAELQTRYEHDIHAQCA